MAEHDDSRDPRVSARYRALGEDGPPQVLDAAILAASRRAVGAGPRRAGASRMRRWALPVSVAAVVVLTMSLVVRVQLERPDLETAAPHPAAPPAAAKKEAPRGAKEKVDNLAKRNAQRLDEPKAKAVPAEPAASAPTAATGERERSTMAQKAMRAPAAPAPAAAPPARAFVPEPPAPKSAAVEAAAPSQLGAAGAVQSSAAPSVAGASADQGVREETQAAGRVAPRAALEDRAQASAEQAGKKDETPREWLERIARLRREGRIKEADDSLAGFRKRYPDYEIPKDLRDAVLGAGKNE